MKVIFWTAVVFYLLFNLLMAYVVPRCEKAGGIFVQSQWGQHCVDKNFKEMDPNYLDN